MASCNRSLEDRLRLIEDREAVLVLLKAIARGTDRNDVPLLTACIHPDARLDWGGGRLLSTADFIAGLAAPGDDASGRMHIVTNHVVEISGDRASAESYFLSCQAIERGGKPLTRLRAGRYADILARQPEGWQLVARTIIDEWSRIDPVTEAIKPGQHLGRPWPHDPSYRLLEAFASGEGLR